MKETAIITSMDDIWSKIPQDARRAWEDQAVATAVEDPKIQTAAILLERCAYDGRREKIRDSIMSLDYCAIPPHRRAEAFEKAAETLIRQELGLDG